MVEAFATKNISRDASDVIRIPPHSTEAEQSLLGGLMIDQRAWDQVADAVSAGDFYRHDHCLVFEAIGRLVERDEPALSLIHI